ncbi:S24 family peptidase [Vibrio viridaestus]|uniref:Phage repressor protein n=1 Tax=Vibrio viridaestus TaxID=2487322 RepID=A0A3N9TGN1_9VIBR|nr:S24 family peptidase [Vibrio viridaestus]RQW63437.1 phage repressor protein [Vibrio viridaestus]
METIGKRLEWRRTQLGLKQEELVSKVKRLLPDASFNRVSVSNLENDVQKSMKDSVFLIVCRVLKCRPEWLAFGSGAIESIEAGPPVEQKCPLLSWVQAGMWTEMPPAMNVDDIDYIACPIRCSSSTFVLKVNGDSMATEYLAGDYIFVDPTQKTPRNGAHVIAMLEDTKEATFKQYVELDGKVMLKALNPEYPPSIRFLPIQDTCLILGTVVCSVRVVKS